MGVALHAPKRPLGLPALMRLKRPTQHTLGHRPIPVIPHVSRSSSERSCRPGLDKGIRDRQTDQTLLRRRPALSPTLLRSVAGTQLDRRFATLLLSERIPATAPRAQHRHRPDGFRSSPLAVGFVPDDGADLAIGQETTTIHSGGVERQCRGAGTADGNHAPSAKFTFALLIDDGGRHLIK
jgi:hypothetical protein